MFQRAKVLACELEVLEEVEGVLEEPATPNRPDILDCNPDTKLAPPPSPSLPPFRENENAHKSATGSTQAAPQQQRPYPSHSDRHQRNLTSCHHRPRRARAGLRRPRRGLRGGDRRAREWLRRRRCRPTLRWRGRDGSRRRPGKTEDWGQGREMGWERERTDGLGFAASPEGAEDHEGDLGGNAG